MTKKTQKPEEKIWDLRMIQFMDSIIDAKKEGSQKEFLRGIGFNPANLPEVRAGKRSFTVKQFYAACEKYNCSMDWFFGFTNRKPRKAEKTPPMELLKEAVSLLEANSKKKR